MSRIISLLASATDTIYALGLIDNLVGRSHECDNPPQIMNLPVCTKPKFETDGSSYEINEKMKAILENSISVYKVDRDLIETLKPSHIITQTQCNVCAVSLNDLEDIICNTLSTRPSIISLEPNNLNDVFNDILKIGQNLGVSERASELVANYKDRINLIKGQIVKTAVRPKVSLIEWINPLMIASNWMPELLDLLDLEYAYSTAGKHSKTIDVNQLLEFDPDYIIICPCGFNIDKSLEEWPVLKDKPGFKNLQAYKSKNIFVANGNDYFNRPGPRIVETVEILAQIVWGFDYGHLNKSFVRVL